MLPSNEEIESYNDKIDRLQEEKAILIDILRSEKFSMTNLKLQDLTSDNVKNVLYLMYPSFKNALNSNMKGKQAA